MSRYLRNAWAAALGALGGALVGYLLGPLVRDDSSDPFGAILIIFGYVMAVFGGSVALGLAERVFSGIERPWSWGSAAPWFALLVTPVIFLVGFIASQTVGWPDDGPRIWGVLLVCVGLAALLATRLAARNRSDWIEPSPGAPN